MMPNRTTSPEFSENEYDITNSISQIESSGIKDDSPLLKQDEGNSDASRIFNNFLETDEDGDEAFIEFHRSVLNKKGSNSKGKNSKKGGGFQAMGLDAHLLKAIASKGFLIPTPIQRKTIPMVLDHKDVVGMARTGSGKTAAFVIPMIQSLKAHSARFGARALILSPSRELASQTLKVVKEFGRGTDLKSVLLVGGDSLEDQFGFMTANPDIIIATPGRFLHLKIEMSLDLSSIKYVVFDEADRLFEMGFSVQLTEILHALPISRQTLLFSATLPKSLVEFAKAGLQEPSLVRLDAESKVSPDLESAFFTVKSAEKEGALLYILNCIIKLPTGLTKTDNKSAEIGKKRKRGGNRNSKLDLAEHSTIIFAATKHHVEYLATILRFSGFAVSFAYGSLDQVARNKQIEDFRSGATNILIVTDVAARGIDIPILANVINYHFPPQPKVFVHRVGRTARAGKRGWSYTLVRDNDAPYLLDLQLFLGKKLVVGTETIYSAHYSEDITVGALPRDKLEFMTESVTKMIRESNDMHALQSVAVKAEKLYIKTRNLASNESVKRAKEIVSSKNWSQSHFLFQNESSAQEQARIDMLTRISDFRPHETIFEVGSTKGNSGYSEFGEMMRHRREKIVTRRQNVTDGNSAGPNDTDKNHIEILNKKYGNDIDLVDNTASREITGTDEASEDEIEVAFSKCFQKIKNQSISWKDSENFMSYTSKNTSIAEERGYGVHSGSYNATSKNVNFLQAAHSLTMDLDNDDGGRSFAIPTKAKGMRWDKKNSKYVAIANDGDGSKGGKMIRGESGQKISANFQSGRFDRWRKTFKLDRLPRTGAAENISNRTIRAEGDFGIRFKHKQVKAPKEADRYRDDYYVRKKRVADAKEKRIGKWKDGTGKQEIKSIDDIRKERKLTERRKAKNARTGKNKK